LSFAADIFRCCKIKSDVLSVVFPILSILVFLVGSIFSKTLAKYNAEKNRNSGVASDNKICSSF